MTKKILMISVPNGAGKTTLTLELIKGQRTFYEFINEDEIAKGLAPLHPESMALTASKLMIARLKELLGNQKTSPLKQLVLAQIISNIYRKPKKTDTFYT